MRRYKVTVAPLFDGKPTWHGLYYYAGHWREVRNDAGNVIAYASVQAAMTQAKRIAEEMQAENPNAG